VRGLLRALFGGRQGRFLVSDDILQRTGAVLRQTASCGPIAWVTEDEAVDAFWGRSAEKQR
jgi:hypothetical protein